MKLNKEKQPIDQIAKIRHVIYPKNVWFSKSSSVIVARNAGTELQVVRYVNTFGSSLLANGVSISSKRSPRIYLIRTKMKRRKFHQKWVRMRHEIEMRFTEKNIPILINCVLFICQESNIGSRYTSYTILIRHTLLMKCVVIVIYKIRGDTT